MASALGPGPSGRAASATGTAAARGNVRRIVAALLVVSILGIAFLAGGFLRFASDVAGAVPLDSVSADGIVALTGGRDRIQGAVGLLENGRARRLLISGVHRQTTADDLARATESASALFACCVDLGHRAATTIGNAEETEAWVRASGFRSLIVVTSAYHMPRSLAELQAAMPDVTLVPYPVKHADLMLDRWYLHPPTAKLLMAEYLKYILARLRLGMVTTPVLGATHPDASVASRG